jgi:membrane-associated phospholipid phosphatase
MKCFFVKRDADDSKNKLNLQQNHHYFFVKGGNVSCAAVSALPLKEGERSPFSMSFRQMSAWLFILLLFLFSPFYVFGFYTFPQEDATDIPKPSRQTFFHSPGSRLIIPAALISYGIWSKENKALQKIDHRIHRKVSEHPDIRLPYDDYLQYVTAAAVYGLDFMGAEARHNIRDRTFIMATAYLMEALSVRITKVTTQIERPDGSNKHSFPSGHTATAFVGAHILFREYKNVSPWTGVAAYGVATATGVMRVLNKKHWASDVIAGAGVGILCAEIGYMLLPVWHNVFGIKEKGFVAAPIIGNRSYGASLVYVF